MKNDDAMVELKLIQPQKAKRRRFSCVACEMTYSLRDYRILYDHHKISYFFDENNPVGVICHNCIEDVALNTKKELGVKKIYVKLKLEKEDILFKF